MKLNNFAGGRNLDVLYHGTYVEHLSSIMKMGLDPSRSTYADEEKFDGPPPHHFVYLSEDPQTALSFGAGGGHSTERDAKQLVLLEIRLPENLQRMLVLDRGEFVRAPFLIEPKFIRRIR